MVIFEPLDQRTTPDAVYGVLRHAILDGSLRPGSQLREAHIAADMGISRAPLREALTRLEREGLIVKFAFRGAFVAEVSASTIAEIAELRFLVEPYAAARLPADEGDRVRRAAKALRGAAETGDIPASIDAHLHFHRLFYECSANETLRIMWDGWESTLRLFLAVDHRSFGDLEDIATAHERLALLAIEREMDQFRIDFAHHLHTAPGEPLDGKPDTPLERTAPRRHR